MSIFNGLLCGSPVEWEYTVLRCRKGNKLQLVCITKRVGRLTRGTQARRVLRLFLRSLGRPSLYPDTPTFWLLALVKMSSPNGDQFRRFAQQLQRQASSGGVPGGRGVLAGGGLLIALIGGGIALSSSLFNGAS
jgi:hypothetical protein